MTDPFVQLIRRISSIRIYEGFDEEGKPISEKELLAKTHDRLISEGISEEGFFFAYKGAEIMSRGE